MSSIALASSGSENQAGRRPKSWCSTRLISLLTEGRPDFLDSAVPGGTTDLLVSYTWRIAFEDTGQQFGLAAALSTVIFLLVAAITLLQMRFTRVAEDAARR